MIRFLFGAYVGYAFTKRFLEAYRQAQLDLSLAEIEAYANEGAE